MAARADRCQKCGGLWDLHCFRCEAVTLCPVPQIVEGELRLVAPCHEVGPKKAPSWTGPLRFFGLR